MHVHIGAQKTSGIQGNACSSGMSWKVKSDPVQISMIQVRMDLNVLAEEFGLDQWMTVS